MLTVIEQTQLTNTEQSRLEQCEAVIERGLKTFVDVGNALLEIRDSRLYRAEFGTFEDYCKDKWGWVASRARQLIAASETMQNLKTVTNVTLLPINEGQVRPLVSLPPEQQREAWAIALDTAPDGKITGAHVQAVVDEIQHKPHVSNNSGNNEWYTPLEYIIAARRVMGEIDLDPASSKIANQNVKASVYFTAEDDGLRFSWDGRVWMNPPYSSDLINSFCEKLADHYANGDVTQAIVLVNNATETGWFQTLLSCASAACFIRRRVKFIDMNGNPSGAPLQGQAILYLGDNPDSFTSEFRKFGAILCPIMTNAE